MTAAAAERLGPDPDRGAMAMAYARRGWPVFPLFEARHTTGGWRCACGRACNAPAKHPRITGWQTAASTDPATVRSWWRQWRRANIGIAAGMSGLVILDVDGRHGGFESLHDLEQALGPLPMTVTALTGGGGEHRLFTAPQGPLIHSSSGALAPGVDVRASGGYIVAPGSRHISGRLYAWDAGAGPDYLPCAALPPAWVARLAEPTRSRPPLRADAPIPAGARNETLTRLAGVLRRYGFAADAIAAALSATNTTRCLPPLPEAAVITIAGSVGRYEPAAFRPTPRRASRRVLEA